MMGHPGSYMGASSYAGTVGVRPGELLVEPAGGVYRVTDVDFDGQRVEIERVMNPGVRVWVPVANAVAMRV